jgi:Icc-related predicted phosphoesterase
MRRKHVSLSVKAIYTSDLHGSYWKYTKLLEVAKQENAQLVINGGDMFPNNWSDYRVAQEQFVNDFLPSYFGCYESAQIHYFSIFGNDDLRVIDKQYNELTDQYQFVQALTGNPTSILGYELVGMDLIPDYFLGPKDRSRVDFIGDKRLLLPEMAEIIEEGGIRKIPNWPLYVKSLPSLQEELLRLPSPKAYSNTIYVAHTPPSHLGLDLAEDITSEGFPVISTGSDALFRFILAKQPRLLLSGHIHDSPMYGQKLWKTMLRKTLAIQAGQIDIFDSFLTYVVMDFASLKSVRKIVGIKERVLEFQKEEVPSIKHRLKAILSSPLALMSEAEVKRLLTTTIQAKL